MKFKNFAFGAGLMAVSLVSGGCGAPNINSVNYQKSPNGRIEVTCDNQAQCSDSRVMDKVTGMCRQQVGAVCDYIIVDDHNQRIEADCAAAVDKAVESPGRGVDVRCPGSSSTSASAAQVVATYRQK